MDEEDDQEAEAEDEDDERVAVQLVGVALKNLAAHEDGGIAGGMGAEEEKEQQSRRGHDQFLADGRGEKSDKPHKRTLGKKL